MGEIMKIVAIEMYIVKVAFGQWRKKWINWQMGLRQLAIIWKNVVS